MSNRVILLVLLALAFSSTSACQMVDLASSPARSEIWDWAALQLPGKTVTELRTSLLDNGDVLISWSYQSPDGKIEPHLATMFQTTRVDVARSVLARGHIVFADGAVSRVVARESASAVLHDGDQVTVISRVYRQCYRGPVRHVLARLDSLGHIELMKAAIYLLDEPKEFIGGGGEPWFGEPNASCPNEPPLHLRFKVETLDGSLLALPDDTLLLTLQGYPTVLRLTRDLETRSLLNNRKIFLLPFDVGGGSLFVDKLTGKNYGSIEEGTARYQEALDDLYAYLLKIRGRK